jgi:cell division septal protein FtsQ
MRKAIEENSLASEKGNKWGSAWRWLTGLIFVVLLGGFASAFLPDKFIVRNIVVTDTRADVAGQIQEYACGIVDSKAQLFGKTNIFLIPRSFLEYDLPKKFPLIQTVQILRELPSTLRISVREKIPVVVLASGSAYFSVDPDGFAFEEISKERMANNKYPIIRDEREDAKVSIGAQVLSTDAIAMMHDIVKQLPDRFALNIDEITIPAIGTQEIHVHTNEGWALILDAGRPLDNQFAVLSKIFVEQIDEKKRPFLSYIDLRAPGKAFYKFRDGT